MKDRQRYIMVRRPLVFIWSIEKMHIVVHACVVPLCTAACFLHTPTCLYLSQIYNLYLQLSHFIPHLNIFLFFQQVSVILFFSSVYMWACASLDAFVCSLFCVRVIITRPPRGNQQWSSDSPDPLVPQHTCPRWAVLTSSEPLYERTCVYELLHHLSSSLVELE